MSNTLLQPSLAVYLGQLLNFTIFSRFTVNYVVSWIYSKQIKLDDLLRQTGPRLLICPYLLQAKLETKALKAKRPGFTDDRYNETSYYIENGKHPVYDEKRILI